MMGMDLLMPKEQNNKFYGVTIAIVTNNQDPKKWVELKLNFLGYPKMMKVIGLGSLVRWQAKSVVYFCCLKLMTKF